jgi:hypothetical protein
MTDKRLLLALPAFALLAACGGNAPAGNDRRAASGEVLEGTISDDMLPVDRVRSEPPLEDPEAFAKARSAADGAGAAGTRESEDGEATETETGEAESAEPAEEPATPAAE